jgi:Tfp pilus assembly protein FimT
MTSTDRMSRSTPRTFARGVTLMELLLVLVLLVVAGSIVIPAIMGAYSSVKLTRAGDAVITRWAEARAQAIETGLVYQFRFTPETGKYRVEPWSNLEADAAATDSPSESSKAETFATRETLDESPTVAAELPESIVFQGGQAAAEDPATRERRVTSLESPQSSWSTPILFFPDGTASQATVVLQSDVPNYLRLTLRGLTGVARASEVLTREEMDRGARQR